MCACVKACFSLKKSSKKTMVCRSKEKRAAMQTIIGRAARSTAMEAQVRDKQHARWGCAAFQAACRGQVPGCYAIRVLDGVPTCTEFPTLWGGACKAESTAKKEIKKELLLESCSYEHA